MLRRNWNAGENRALLFALFIAVASVTTVGFFADRVAQALKSQAAELIGGDLVVISDHPLAAQFRDTPDGVALARAESVTFPSMVRNPLPGGGANLAEIKAVTPGFPLRGRLRISGGNAGEREAAGIPARGTVWVAPALLGKIDAQSGDTVQVGALSLRIAAVLTREPDAVLDYFGIAPRLMMNAADLPATRLIQNGSRVTYRLLLAGESSAVDRYRALVQPRLARGERIEGVRDARSEVRVALDRAGRFLGLASLLSVVLAAAAVALAARRFTQRQMDHCAMMRCLGASQADIFMLNFYQFVWLGLIASVTGALAGYAAQGVLAGILAGFFTVTLPQPTIMPALQGALTGFVLLLGFTVPPLLGLKSVSTLRVLRREIATLEGVSVAAYGMGFAALAVLIVWRAGEVRLGMIALGGFAAVLVVAGLAGWLLIVLASRLRGSVAALPGGTLRGALRYGLANMQRRSGASLVQIMALGLGITAMLLLTLVRTDLIATWQGSLGSDAANRFVINVQPDQLRAVQAYLAGNRLATPGLYPMVRGRLVAINGQPLAPERLGDERAKRLAEREFNLSWAENIRADNKIVAGAWWDGVRDEKQFSVEEGIAKTLGIKLGDELTYDIAGETAGARVTSLRKVDWDSFKPNFYVVGTPVLLEKYPASYITSFYLAPGNEALVTELVKRFPNLSVIDVSAIMAQVRSITTQVSNALEFVFLFALAAGLVVLYAAIAATQDERIFEGAIMRTLGARRRQLVMLQLAEFVAIGFLAGLVAAGGAVALAMVLSDQVLNVPYNFNPWVPVAGLLAGTLGVALAGLFGTRSTINSPPLETIRGVA